MTHIIAIGNTKGGTAKTTTALNLATELGILGFNTLVTDFDPQASLSKALLTENELPLYKGIEDLLFKPGLNVVDFIAKTKIDNVSIIPCHLELGDVALKLVMKASFYALKDVLKKVEGFDFILIDTQPSKNILMLNAFTASDYILIPSNPGVYPLMEIVELEETIKSTAANSNPNLEILGVLVTMTQRATVYKQLEKDLRSYFGEKTFKTSISRLAKSEESAVEGVGVSRIDPKCKLALQYKDLTCEILERLNAVRG